MFYRPGAEKSGLPHDPFKALISPRPIGWISTIGPDGRVNLAPFSFFNAVADNPPMLMFCMTGTKPDGSEKDTLVNLRRTGEFVHNVVPEGLKDAMNITSGPWPFEENEFERAGLEAVPSETVVPPRVAAAPAAFECRVWQLTELPGNSNHMVIGEVTGIHIDDGILTEGRADVTRYNPLARLGYRDYSAVEEVFPLKRPGQV